VSIELGPRVTVFFGRNGQGKTNLVEGAYYVIGFRSFRTSSTSDLILWGKESADIEADFTLRGLDRSMRVRLALGRKTTTLNGKTVRRDSDSLEGAGIVVFGPDDLQLLKAAASERRRALDRSVFAVRRSYYREALTFERALKARNGLLRRGGFSRELLESHDETLAVAGARVVFRRREMATALAPRFAAAFSQIHGDRKASLRYRSHARVEEATTESEIGEALRVGLADGRSHDERRGFTGFGPQTDDVDVFLEERLARDHGSQGQMRSLVLALKIAELHHTSEHNRETPLLLLDDVASELDEERRARLFETISSMACQTLITITEREHLPALPGRIDWRVSGGRIALA
jgi:DNA replication and repair protein RecF